MTIRFSKYHGTGNDFILIDNRLISWKPTDRQVAFLCDRHTGIGADGLMLLDESAGFDFAMTYYNSDGHESTMCGNGGRCMTAFAQSLGISSRKMRFRAIDGEHESEVMDPLHAGIYRVKMIDTRIGAIFKDGYFLNTGSPHFVQFVKDAGNTDVFNAGRLLRHDRRFAPGGTNVDFVEMQDDTLFVRTYERGVENETLSCGTGVTAAAIVAAFRDPVSPGNYNVRTPGGDLKVSFSRSGDSFRDIWLEGEATKVFDGEVEMGSEIAR
jgi:diaminopimelate epimerase